MHHELTIVIEQTPSGHSITVTGVQFSVKGDRQAAEDEAARLLTAAIQKFGYQVSIPAPFVPRNA